MIANPSRVLLAVVFLSCTPAANAAERSIQPAAHSTPVALPPLTAEESVTFAQQPARVGDRVAQTVEVELQLNTTITQADQEASANQSNLLRRQQRFVEVLEVEAGNVRRAHVTFPLSRLTVGTVSEANSEEEVTQPVEKQSYSVTRDGERLLVTDNEGAIPPQAEYEIVVTSLQNLGLPNPLVGFLLGRTIHVGEKLGLPQEIAEEVLGFGDQFSEVEEFSLELKSIEVLDNQRCAVFAATIAAIGEPSAPMRIRAFGRVVIQTQTCRIVRAELSGPLTLSTVEHTPAGDFQYSARGGMKVAVQVKYGHAK